MLYHSQGKFKKNQKESLYKAKISIYTFLHNSIFTSIVCGVFQLNNSNFKLLVAITKQNDTFENLKRKRIKKRPKQFKLIQ